MNRSSYLDVVTVRQSHGMSRRPKTQHCKLLVEPVMLPEMQHLTVDDSREVSETCLFYPTGHKNINMRRSMEEIVRKVMQTDKVPRPTLKTLTVLTPKRKKKVLDATMPVQPLFYSKRASASATEDEMADLLGCKKRNEAKLRGVLKSEF